MPDGYYTNTAKVKNSNGFAKLEMYVESNGKIQTYFIREENALWKVISIERITVENGKVEIGFLAEGISNSFLYVDDVVLVKTKLPGDVIVCLFRKISYYEITILAVVFNLIFNR